MFCIASSACACCAERLVNSKDLHSIKNGLEVKKARADFNLTTTGEKYLFAIEIIAALVVLILGICGMLCSQGLDLGVMNFMNGIAPSAAWMMMGVGGGIILLDLVGLVIRLVKHGQDYKNAAQNLISVY